MTDAPERIWAVTEPNDVSADILGDVYAQQLPDGMVGKPTEYIRADLVLRWSDDMDAAPKDGTVILAVPWGPATGLEDVAPTYWIASEERWANWWWSSEPTHWMRIAPPKEGE